MILAFSGRSTSFWLVFVVLGANQFPIEEMSSAFHDIMGATGITHRRGTFACITPGRDTPDARTPADVGMSLLRALGTWSTPSRRLASEMSRRRPPLPECGAAAAGAEVRWLGGLGRRRRRGALPCAFRRRPGGTDGMGRCEGVCWCC